MKPLAYLLLFITIAGCGNPTSGGDLAGGATDGHLADLGAGDLRLPDSALFFADLLATDDSLTDDAFAADLSPPLDEAVADLALPDLAAPDLTPVDLLPLADDARTVADLAHAPADATVDGAADLASRPLDGPRFVDAAADLAVVHDLEVIPPDTAVLRDFGSPRDLALRDLALPDLARADAGFVTAPHLPFPQIITTGGAILDRVNLVTVTFPQYPYQAQAQKFGDVILTSSWWSAVGKEYGVNSGVHFKKVVLPALAGTAFTDADIMALINQSIAANRLPSPVTTAQVYYLLYFPSNVTINNQGVACVDFDAYHSNGSYNGTPYPYGVVPDCNKGAGFVIDSSSHELIESATDPYADAWGMTVPNNDHWVGQNLDEVADLCGFNPLVPESGFLVERSWSNKLAKASASPCAPIPAGEIYTNVSPAPTRPVTLAAGQSAAFTLTGWSTAPTADWNLVLALADNTDFDPTRANALSATTINNNRTVKLTLTVPLGTASGKVGSVLVCSDAKCGRYWPVTVFSK